ncbi:MAG: tRNA pseudouridine(38-40) synthase TruA [Salibacteraceae bacterium]
MAHRYFIELSYDGTAYHGWQVQPNAKTIQETLNNAISTIIRKEIYCVGCGRTDTGVHAQQFYAHFDVTQAIENTSQLTYKANRVLPKDIAIHRIFEVEKDTHSRFSAINRTYKYRITQFKDPFSINRKWEMRDKVDVNVMNQAAKLLLGEQDFTSFSKSNTQTETNICNVMHAEWQTNDRELIFNVKANRFLRNMVRALVGTLVDVGKGSISIAEFESIIKTKNRSEAGLSVPAHGLYLTEIEYPGGALKNG